MQHQVTTFSLDGIVGLDGKPKVLEFNRGVNSGDIGYRRAYGGARIIDKVIEDLKQWTGVDHVWFERGYQDFHFCDRPQRDYNPRDTVTWKSERNAYILDRRFLDPYATHLVFPAANLSHYHATEPTRKGRLLGLKPTIHAYANTNIPDAIVLSHIPEPLRDHISIADNMQGLDSLYSNKKIITRMLHDGIINPAHFPAQAEYSLDSEDYGGIAKQIADRFTAAAQGIILKHPSLCTGLGMEYVRNPRNLKEIENAMTRLLFSIPKRFDTALDDVSPLDFIAQELIVSKPLSVRESFDKAGAQLDSKGLLQTVRNNFKRLGVFRLFMSQVNGDIKLHDGWVKFSNSSTLAGLKDRFKSGTNFSGPLPQSQKQALADALTPDIQKIFQALPSYDPEPAF